MNVLIVVPPERLLDGRVLMALYVHEWEEAGLKITNRCENWIRADNDDRITVVPYPHKSEADVCGQHADLLMVHLDLVCRKDWREIEVALIATTITAKGPTKVLRSGEFKVYATGVEWKAPRRVDVRPDGTLKVAFSLQPPCTKHCENDKCWWRQRDIHGLSPWYYNAPVGDPKKVKHDVGQQAIAEKYGVGVFPEMRCIVGTNVLYVSCEGWTGGCDISKSAYLDSRMLGLTGEVGFCKCGGPVSVVTDPPQPAMKKLLAAGNTMLHCSHCKTSFVVEPQ